jgi:hypothetical protein
VAQRYGIADKVRKGPSQPPARAVGPEAETPQDLDYDTHPEVAAPQATPVVEVAKPARVTKAKTAMPDVDAL